MRLTLWVALPFAVVLGLSFSAGAEGADVIYTSPSGPLRIEQNGQDVWVVSTKDSAQRAKLPRVESSYFYGY